MKKAADLIKNPLVLEFFRTGGAAAVLRGRSGVRHHRQTGILSPRTRQGLPLRGVEKTLHFDNDHFFVDLVFYNRLLRCYVLIDLKRDKLTHQDLGQMQMYVNYFDRHVRFADELPTIGILLCHRKNDAFVELTLPGDDNIFASQYQLYLPSK